MLPSELMLDIFPLFARFELDDFKFVSREYRRLIDRTVPLFSFRLFYNVDIREGEIDFSIELPYGKQGVVSTSFFGHVFREISVYRNKFNRLLLQICLHAVTK